MAAVEKHRRPSIGRRKLKSPGRGHIGGLDLGNHASERSITKPILGHCEDLRILGTLRIQHAVRAQSDLFQPGRIQIKRRERPQDRSTTRSRKPRRNARGKQCRGSIIARAGGRSGNLVEAAVIQSMIGKSLVHLGYAEWKGGTPRRARSR